MNDTLSEKFKAWHFRYEQETGRSPDSISIAHWFTAELTALKQRVEGEKGSVQGLSSAGGQFNTLDEAHAYNAGLDKALHLIDEVIK